MAVNRYDVPAQDRYFNTYVPLPYEQIMNTVAARQAQVEREQEMLNKTFEETKNIPYIPGTKDEAYVRDYLGKTSSLVDKYFGADLSDPIVKQQMRKEFGTITNKQNLQNIKESHTAWKQNQEYKSKLKAEGLYDPMLDEDPATTGQWDTIGSGRVYDYVTSPFKNPRPSAETYFNNIKPSDLGESGDYYWEGIDDSAINKVVNSKWGEFSNTSEGSLYVKKIAKERGLDPNDLKTREQIAKEYLTGVGEEFKYKQRAGTTLDAQTRAAKARSGKDTTSTGYVTPYVPAPAQAVLGDKKYTARNVLNERDNLASESEKLSKAISDLQTMDSSDPRIPQLQLELQSIIDRKGMLDSTVDGATAFWKEKFKSDYDKVEDELAKQAAKHKTSVNKIKETYKDFDFIKTDVGALAGIPNYIINYYDKIKNLDKKTTEKIEESIEQGGIKATSDKRILTMPLNSDEGDNIYYIDQEGSKVYTNSSSFIRAMKENPQSINVIQEDAATKEGRKDKNQEIEDLHANIRNASKFFPTGYSTSRNLDGSFDVMFTTKFRNSKTGADVPDRSLRVRLTDESQIRTMAQDIAEAGHPVEADIILNPEVSNDIKRHTPREIGESYTVTPYPGWYPYNIKKVEGGWNILDEAGNKVTSGEMELPIMPTIDDVINYMYRVRNFVSGAQRAQSQAQ